MTMLGERARASAQRPYTATTTAAGRGAGGVLDRRGEVGDVLRDWVLRANGTGIDAIALASLRHGIVTGVEVLAVLEVLGEVVGARGELAVETEEALLLWGEGLLRHGQVSG